MIRHTNSRYFFIALLVCACCVVQPVYSQYSLGTSGLMTIPSADMMPDGTFMVGGNYLPSSMLPAPFEQNTGNYFAHLTFLPFVEMTYRCTLEKVKIPQETRSWQQDRSVSLRLRVLKEKRYIPALVVGSNDAFTTYELNPFSNNGGNRFFSSIYGVVSKTLPLAGYRLGVTLGYYLPVRKQSSTNQGFLCGLKYTPAFCPLLDVMVDYNGETVSAGVSALLFKHLRLHVLTYGGRDISGGLRYEFILIPHKQ